MKKQKKRFLSAILCVAMLFCFVPLAAYGAETPVDTIDLNSKKDLDGAGYHWDASSMVLTLTDANLKTSGGDVPLIQLPKTGDVTIRLVGENFLQVTNTYGVVIGNSETAKRNERGTLTIEGDGTGSLSVKGCIKVYGEADTVVSGCILSIEPVGEATGDSWAYSNPMKGNFIVKDGAKVLTVGRFMAGKDLLIDGGVLENTKVGCTYVHGDVSVVNGGVLRVKNETENLEAGAIHVEGDFTADETSVVELVNEAERYGMYLSPRGDVTLLSKEIHIEGQEQAILTEKEGSDAVITLPEALQNQYEIVKEPPQNQWHYTNIYETVQNEEEGAVRSIVKNLSYLSEEAAAEKEALKEAVEAAEIKLSSGLTKKGKISLSWSPVETEEEQPEMDMDYYEVFRSTRKSSGYTTEAYYTTTFGLKKAYTNTSVKAGTTYYYKVRGVKIIDGEVYYTQWSNKAWRTAK